MGLVINSFDYQRFTHDKTQRRAVLAPGCFDILHSGHVRMLERAANLGSPLIVAVNSDASTRELKGPLRPIVPQKDRAEVLAALSFVSFVIIFDGDLDKLIEEIRPDVLVKGEDWRNGTIKGRAILESYGGRVEIIPSRLDGHDSVQSTTKILKNFLEKIGAAKWSSLRMNT